MWGGLVGILVVAWAAALWRFDVRERRLPAWLTLPAAAGALPWISLAGCAWAGLYLALGVARGGIGGGDIKLALPLGIAVAHVAGWSGVLAAVFLANVATLVAQAARWHWAGAGDPAPAHGPGMLAAAGSVVAWGIWGPQGI